MRLPRSANGKRFSFQKNLGYFVLYLYLDTFFLYASLACIVIGILIQHPVMFRNSLIFALKFYPSSCIYSLFKKLGGCPLTFSNYTSMAQNTPISNPTIRLARPDEFEDASNKSSNASMRPKVSFNESYQEPSMSEPNLSPSGKTMGEPSILKPSVRTSLQIPVNNSYP